MILDPFKFAVTGHPVYSVVDLPGRPISVFGRVRDVDLEDGDLPTRCVTFTQTEAATAAGLRFRLHEQLRRRLIPFPDFKSSVLLASGRMKPTNVYLYPEAEAIVALYSAIAAAGRRQLHREKDAGIIDDLQRTISAVRAEARERLDYG